MLQIKIFKRTNRFIPKAPDIKRVDKWIFGKTDQSLRNVIDSVQNVLIKSGKLIPKWIIELNLIKDDTRSIKWLKNGNNTTLAGWIEAIMYFMFHVFYSMHDDHHYIILRDSHGLVHIKLTEEDATKAGKIGRESVIKVIGTIFKHERVI